MDISGYTTRLWNALGGKKKLWPMDIMRGAAAIAEARLPFVAGKHTAEGFERLPEDQAEIERKLKAKIEADESQAACIRRFGAKAFNDYMENSEFVQKCRRGGRTLSDGQRAHACAILLSEAGPEPPKLATAKPAAPSVPSLPTAPTTTTTTTTAAQPSYKPAAPSMNADMLAKLIAGVFGTGTLQALDSRPLKRDEAFGAAVAKSQWCASSAADVRATYKPQAAAPTEAERLAAYKSFLFAHHVNVAGLDYSDLGEPKACPLTAKQQAVAQRLTDEFFAVVQGKESAKFSTSPAARAGREFLKAQSTTVKA